MQGILGTPLDYVIIIAYFLFITLFGTFFSRYIKTTKEFFLGGQRFPWWLISFSCVASLVGSYSFIKYSSVGYLYGFSSTMTYANDIFLLPIFMFCWLPVIYFSRVLSIPEYLGKRFDPSTRVVGTIILIIYLVGYVGINLYTLGVAIHTLTGFPIFWGAVIVAVLATIYVVAGGQTAVIWTDLVQAFFLLAAGIGLFVGGILFLKPYGGFWHFLPDTHKYALAYFNRPPDFNFVGIFWQDAIANSFAFWLMNQGIMMRFMSAKSLHDAKRAAIFNILVLILVASIATSGGGWVARALVSAGFLPKTLAGRDAFVRAAHLLCRPGVFGFVLAALTAALMSTVDTLLNAVSAVFVNDIWRPLIVKKAPDRHYLRVGRIVCMVSACLGILLVPIYMKFKTIYAAHGAFTATVTPPMVVAIVLGCIWKRYTPRAAFWTLLGGIIAVFLSIKYDILLAPFSFGIPRSGWFFIRALYGLTVSTVIAVVVTFLTKPAPIEKINGLVWGTHREAMRKFKQGEPNEEEGKPVILWVKQLEEDIDVVRVPPKAMESMKAKPGDILYITDYRWWFGGLHSLHAKAGDPITEEEDFDKIYISKTLVEQGYLRDGMKVYVEKTL